MMTDNDFKSINEMLEEVEDLHKGELKGISERSEDYEEGFVNGIKFVREHLLAAYFEAELED